MNGPSFTIDFRIARVLMDYLCLGEITAIGCGKVSVASVPSEKRVIFFDKYSETVGPFMYNLKNSSAEIIVFL